MILSCIEVMVLLLNTVAVHLYR